MSGLRSRRAQRSLAAAADRALLPPSKSVIARVRTVLVLAIAIAASLASASQVAAQASSFEMSSPAAPGPVLGLDLAAPLEEEPVAHIDQPDASKNPVFDQYFGGGFAPLGEEEHALSTAVGNGRLFVASASSTKVHMFDARTLASVGTFDIPLTQSKCTLNWACVQDGLGPRGLAYYRGELYVSSRAGTVYVYDAAGNKRRELKAPIDSTVTNAAMWPSFVVNNGLDVAWGEVWLTFTTGARWQDGYPTLFGAQAGGVVALDAQTGALRAAVGHLPRRDCDYYPGLQDPPSLNMNYCIEWEAAQPDRYGWWDLASVPELNAVVAQCRGINRGILASGLARDDVSLDDVSARVSPSNPAYYGCVDGQHQDGTDAVWGMKWFISVNAGPRGTWPYRGYAIHEYSLSKEGDHTRLTLRRSWNPQDATSGNRRDIAYNNRDTRLDWSGPLTGSNWLRGQQCLDYVVSDADIYVVGHRGERWFEQARAFESVELAVNGSVKASSTSPSGQLCIESAALAHGRHNLTLTARVGGKTMSKTNDDLRLDNGPPTGRITEPETYVKGTATFYGKMDDAHSGPLSWVLEVQREGDTSWKRPCPPATAPDETGRYSCAWNSADGGYSDGSYRLRAVMRDRSSGDGNVQSTSEVTEIEVNNVDEVEGPTPTDAVDAAFDAEWQEAGAPETDSEPAPFDDGYEGGADSHDWGRSLSCSSGDEWSEIIEPTYEDPLDVSTQAAVSDPDAALALFLAPGGIPPTVFEKAEQGADYAIYVATLQGQLRAFTAIERDPVLGWIATQYEGCSQFPDEAGVTTTTAGAAGAAEGLLP